MPSDSNRVRRQRGFRVPLPVQMLMGLILGCAIGYLWPGFGKELLPVGQAFLKALRMLIVPLVFSCIVLGIYQMGQNIGVLGRVIGLAFTWFYAATGACVAAGIALNEIFHPGLGAGVAVPGGNIPKNTGLSVDWVQFFLDLIPANIVSAMGEQKILPMLVFGILFGAALPKIHEPAQPILAVLRVVQLATMKMVRWVIALAPLAVTGVMASLIASQGSATLFALARLIGVLYIGLAVVISMMCLVLLLIGENPFFVLRKIAEPLILAFTTRSSEITLPIHMEILERMGVPNKLVSTVVPLGYSFNQDGSSLYVSLAVCFVIEAHGIQLDPPAMLTIVFAGLITTKGIGNVGGGALIAATTVIVAMGLPVEAIAIVAGVDVFMDMGRTAVNVMGNTVAVLLVRRFSKRGEYVPALAQPAIKEGVKQFEVIQNAPDAVRCPAARDT
jgi:dicarboxylate/amino acid:cation (Na+ or H+) symporter, DAACS family